jgi:hypothetical protein
VTVQTFTDGWCVSCFFGCFPLCVISCMCGWCSVIFISRYAVTCRQTLMAPQFWQGLTKFRVRSNSSRHYRKLHAHSNMYIGPQCLCRLSKTVLLWL